MFIKRTSQPHMRCLLRLTNVQHIANLHSVEPIFCCLNIIEFLNRPIVKQKGQNISRGFL